MIPTAIRSILLCCLLMLSFTGMAQERYEVKYGTVRFRSEGPGEVISAYSNKLTGHIDLKNKTFSFRLYIASFRGFNCALLRLQFNADAMESHEYPEASFTGNILDQADLTRDGEYTVRAKGKMIIHGVEQYRIIRVHVVSKGGEIRVDSSLPVLFEEHNIRLPKVWTRKMAAAVTVDVTASLTSVP